METTTNSRDLNIHKYRTEVNRVTGSKLNRLVNKNVLKGKTFPESFKTFQTTNTRLTDC
jgi:hypothetical protein